MAAPWLGVPLPGGSPAPSGPMLRSQSARSASVTGLPSPGVSAATAAPVVSTKANETTNAKLFLRIHMLGLPFIVDAPAGDDIHMSHREGGHRDIDLGLTAFGEHLAAG